MVSPASLQMSVCGVDGCDKPYQARGYCDMHYRRWLRHGDVQVVKVGRRKPVRVDCKIGDCDRPHKARGWCKMHYSRWKRNGDPHLVKGLRRGCKIDGCDRAHEARGRCAMHYGRWRRSGQATIENPDDPFELLDRFIAARRSG